MGDSLVVTTSWRISPSLDSPRAGIWLGAGEVGRGIWLASLAEVTSGARRSKIWLSTGKEQVVAIVGKRGSGKSFTLGVIAEGIASRDNSALAQGAMGQAVLLFDPLDVYWTTRFPVEPSNNREAQRHYELAKNAGIAEGNFSVSAWIPGHGNRRSADPEWFNTLELPIPALGIEEWELLLGINIMSDPMGQAFTDVLSLVRDTGYQTTTGFVPASDQFDTDDLAAAVSAPELEPQYHRETLRALRQRLTSLGNTGLFSAAGTSLQDLIGVGQLTIVMLGRIPQSYRTAVVAVLTRMLIDHRNNAAFAEKRLALDPQLSPDERLSLQQSVDSGVPRTLVMLDEAQSFLAPNDGNPAKGLFIRLVKEGRNMGLSAVVATQQPSAVDPRVLSQVEIFIAHQLVTEGDIRAVRENLKAALPDKIQLATQQMDVSSLMRQLPAGIALISAADMNTAIRRSIVASIRPRATIHGGIEL